MAKFDGVIEASATRAGGSSLSVHMSGGERLLGHVLLDRPTLLIRLQEGRRFVTGRRKPLLASILKLEDPSPPGKWQRSDRYDPGRSRARPTGGRAGLLNTRMRVRFSLRLLSASGLSAPIRSRLRHEGHRQDPLQDEKGSFGLVQRFQSMLEYGVSWPAEIEAQKAVIAQLERVLEKGYTLIRNLNLRTAGSSSR